MNDYRSRMFTNYSSKVQRFATTFDREHAERWGYAYDCYLRDWLPPSRDARILDVACGAGRLLHFFARRGFTNVTGVDISGEQVALARQVSKHVVQADALAFLDDGDEQFDLIVGLDIVEHFDKDNVLRFLDACHRRLTPGGRLVLQTPNAESPWGSVHRYNDLTHEVGFNPNALACVAEICGFDRPEARELGPVIHGVKSFVRRIGWNAIRAGLKAWNLIETGDVGSGVYTRVFIMSLRKAVLVSDCDARSTARVG